MFSDDPDLIIEDREWYVEEPPQPSDWWLIFTMNILGWGAFLALGYGLAQLFGCSPITP